MIGQHRTLWREMFGDATVDLCLSKMNPEEREELVFATPLSWVPFPILERFYGLLAEETGHDVPTLHADVVRIGVERNAKTLWRALMKLTSDKALVRRAPVLFGKGYDRGTLDAAIDEPGRARMTVTDFPDMDDFVRRGMRVAFEALLTVGGRKDVRAEIEATEDGAVLYATWRK